MDEKTKNLISMGASIAANCIPCFEHYYLMAEKKGITEEEIKDVIMIAEKVKNGAGVATRQFVCDIMAGMETDMVCPGSCSC